MTPLARAVLSGILGAYLAIKSYLYFRNSSSERSWITPYGLILFAALLFYSAFDAYRRRSNPGPAPKFEPPTRNERLVYKAMGAFVILAGAVVLSIGCWLAWQGWTRVAQWPRANAILVRKDISTVGARLVFDYEVDRRHFTGVAFRWGSESAVRAALESYKPGTVHKISYDPHDPAQVDTTLNYGWELFKAPVSGLVIGLALILGGAIVYRWSIVGHFRDLIVNPSGHTM